MTIADRAPFTGVISRTARALWWCGIPLIVLGSLLFGRELCQPDVLFTIANRVGTVSPLAAELIAHYPLWLITTLSFAGVTFWSHYRRVPNVRLESLALPAFIAGMEACTRLSWFLRCHGIGSPVPLSDMHKDLHVAATASLVAMTAPLLVGALLMTTCPKGLSGSLSRRSLLSMLAATASITLIWLLYDTLLRGSIAPPAP